MKTTHVRPLQVLILMVASSWCAIGWSATIKFGTTNVSGNMWRYDYSVSNDTLASEIQEFTVFFDRGLYQNLSLAGSPVNWDSIVVQPDLQLPANGFFDSLALASGIGVGASLSGFAVQFEYLGTGTPGAQPFDIVNPSTFLPLESGVTTQVVPLPAAIWLLFSGLASLVATAARRPNGKVLNG